MRVPNQAVAPQDEDVVADLTGRYINELQPDMSLAVIAQETSSASATRINCIFRCCELESRGQSPGTSWRTAGGSRTAQTDMCMVHEASPDGSHAFPPGTRFKKPPAFLAQLVAEAIEASPSRMLTTQMIYEVLKRRYPYYRFLCKKAAKSWQSSVRRALNQRWFARLPAGAGCRFRDNFWRVNYENRPERWTLPQRGSARPRQDSGTDAPSDGQLQPVVCCEAEPMPSAPVACRRLQGLAPRCTSAPPSLGCPMWPQSVHPALLGGPAGPQSVPLGRDLLGTQEPPEPFPRPVPIYEQEEQQPLLGLEWIGDSNNGCHEAKPDLEHVASVSHSAQEPLEAEPYALSSAEVAQRVQEPPTGATCETQPPQQAHSSPRAEIPGQLSEPLLRTFEAQALYPAILLPLEMIPCFVYFSDFSGE